MGYTASPLMHYAVVIEKIGWKFLRL